MEYKPDEQIMKEAIKMAYLARGEGDYAIGALTVRDGEIFTLGENKVKIDNDPTAHAEIVAIRKATQITSSRHLEGVVLYSTHEPCPMCTSAAIWAKMDGIISGTYIEDMADYRKSHPSSQWLWRTIDVHPKYLIDNTEENLFLIRGFMRDECLKLFHSTQ
ncbi:nucleoside deaminase [Candidatus Woesearchaeota archaeon]|nr:nucleoside deaminase [Candidatus Woesearchaeota archaeon]